MKNYVLYHNDADGFCAAWVFSKVLKGETVYLPVQYGEEPPEEVMVIGKSSYTFIVDFSYSRELLQEMSAYSPLVVLDHHKTAEKELADLPYCIFDMDRAGCRLAFDYWVMNEVNFTKQVEDIVNYVQDHDLWRFDLPKSREIRAAIASYPFHFEVWDTFKIPTLVKEGEAILRYQKQIIKRHKEFAKEVDFCGHKVLMTRAPDTTVNSELGQELAKDGPFGVTYFDVDGYRVFSLRSVSDFDVSALAKQFGGGGHAKAAGFRMPLL